MTTEPLGLPAQPLQLAREWRRARVASTCPHWEKSRVLPLLRLRQFLASFAGGAVEPIVGQRPVRASRPFVTTLDQDKETRAWLDGQNRKQRHDLRSYIHMESMAMCREDHAGTLWRHAQVAEQYAKKLQQIIDDLQAKARIVATQRPAAAAPLEARFRAGQSVLQWWASWFKKEGPAPKVYGKRSKHKRPSWYSGELVSTPVWAENMEYAGVKHTGWVYPTH